jgi:GNAT superfamily N-acetyltransferase
VNAGGVRIARVAAADVRPLRGLVLRPGEAPQALVFAGDDDPDSLHLAAHDAAGEVIGVASLRVEPAPGNAGVVAWRLRGMATHPERRSHGIGGRLLRGCFRHVRAEGGGLLWCNARVAAVDFYERHGLRREGSEFDIPGVGPHYVMSRRLAHLRPARIDEAPLLTALALRSKAHWGYPKDFMERCAAELRVEPDALASGTRHHAVAEVRGEVAGFYVLVPDLAGTALLDALFVEPQWMGRGMGRELFEHARGLAVKLGAARLIAVADPHAAEFYTRMGATPAGEVPSGSEPGRWLPRFAVDFC